MEAQLNSITLYRLLWIVVTRASMHGWHTTRRRIPDIDYFLIWKVAYHKKTMKKGEERDFTDMMLCEEGDEKLSDAEMRHSHTMGTTIPDFNS